MTAKILRFDPTYQAKNAEDFKDLETKMKDLTQYANCIVTEKNEWTEKGKFPVLVYDKDGVVIIQATKIYMEEFYVSTTADGQQPKITKFNTHQQRVNFTLNDSKYQVNYVVQTPQH